LTPSDAALSVRHEWDVPLPESGEHLPDDGAAHKWLRVQLMAECSGASRHRDRLIAAPYNWSSDAMVMREDRDFSRALC
jgi:hypothetical protein